MRFFHLASIHDFKLYEKGLKLIFPPGASNSCLWTDGSAIAMKAIYDVRGQTTSWPFLSEAAEYNAKQVAAFSKKDADTCLEFVGKISHRLETLCG